MHSSISTQLCLLLDNLNNNLTTNFEDFPTWITSIILIKDQINLVVRLGEFEKYRGIFKLKPVTTWTLAAITSWLIYT